MKALKGSRDREQDKRKPRLINGKVWVPAETLPGGYRALPEDDPSYEEIYLALDTNERFAGMLDWLYRARHHTSKEEKE